MTSNIRRSTRGILEPGTGSSKDDGILVVPGVGEVAPGFAFLGDGLGASEEETGCGLLVEPFLGLLTTGFLVPCVFDSTLWEPGRGSFKTCSSSGPWYFGKKQNSLNRFSLESD